jgi:hypothetical protein
MLGHFSTAVSRVVETTGEVRGQHVGIGMKQAKTAMWEFGRTRFCTIGTDVP